MQESRGYGILNTSGEHPKYRPTTPPLSPEKKPEPQLKNNNNNYEEHEPNM